MRNPINRPYGSAGHVADDTCGLITSSSKLLLGAGCAEHQCGEVTTAQPWVMRSGLIKKESHALHLVSWVGDLYINFTLVRF